MLSRLSPTVRFLLIALVGFLLALSTSHPVEAANPQTKWSMIETPHFTVVYDSRQQQLGRLYAAQAEQAFALVAPAFGVWPDKTVIIVDDETDLSNGLATPWPYPTITAYPVLPLSGDVVGEYGDWGLELLTHEYTHILNFEPATGIFKPLRWIFGSIVRPNALVPRWYSEGLAVEMETRTSTFGRLRSGAFLSIARAMVEEGTLRAEDISRINESIPEWPGGNRPYLMGALIWDELTRKGGDKIIGELNLAYSKHLPFFIDRPLRARLGVDYATVLSNVYDRVEARASAQIAAIKAGGFPAQEKIAKEGFFSQAPSISPDGQKLAFVARAHNIPNYIVLKDRGAEKKSFAQVQGKKLLESDDVNRIAWLSDSKSFIYDSVDTVNRYYSYSDLWRCDVLDSGKCKSRRLTKALRAREPAPSPDSKTIVFAQNTPGSTRLASVRIDGKEPRVLYEPPIQTRVSQPTFLSAEEIVFSERKIDGKETLKLLRVRSDINGDLSVVDTNLIDILPRYAPAHTPEMTPEGLIFISDRNGVANFYLARKDLKAARPLTNVTTRVMNGDFDAVNRELIFSRLESSGAAIYSMPFDEGKALPVALPAVSPLLDTSYPQITLPTASTEMVEKEYSAARYMIPRYWFPYGYFLPGGLYAQAQTSAFDPLGRHSYSLTVAGDTLSKKASLFGSYTNAVTDVPVTIAAQDIHEYLYGSGIVRRTTAASLSGSFFLPKLSNSYRGGLSWQYLNTETTGTDPIRQGPRATFSYRKVSQMGFEISPEKGGSFSISHAHYIEDLGNIGYDQTDISASKFLSGFILPDRHAIALSVNASLAPNLKRTLLGRSTVGGNFQNGLIQDAFLMRGYGSGVFLGRNLISATAEYRFPLMYNYRGMGTWPLFFKRLHADVFVDGISLDGVSFDSRSDRARNESLGRVYFGTGVEAKFDATVFYYVPVQLIVGAYYGTDRGLNPDGVFPFIGFGL